MKAIFLAGLLTAIPSANADVRVSDVDFQPTVTVQNQTLVLNGAGLLRWKGIFKVYAAAHYRQFPELDFDLASDEWHRLELAYLRPISADAFVKATEAAFAEALPDGETFDQWNTRLTPFLAAYNAVDKGDRYALTVSADQFTLELNGRSLFASEDTEVGRRLLNVWLGERSAAPDLRDDLLAVTD